MGEGGLHTGGKGSAWGGDLHPESGGLSSSPVLISSGGHCGGR